MKSPLSVKMNNDSSGQNNVSSKHSGDVGEFFEHSPVAFYTCDKDGYLTYFNKAATALWGRIPTIEKDLWCGSMEIFYPDGTPMPLEEYPMTKTLKTGISTENAKITIKRPDASYKTLLVFPQPVYDKKGTLQGAHNILVDITDQQNDKMKQAVLSAIVESSDDAIISKDLNGKITSWNSGAKRIFKYSEEEILGKSINLLIPDSRLAEEELILSNIRKGNMVDHYETLRKDKNGIEIPLSLTISPIKDAHGNVIGASKVARDISDRLKEEEKQALLSAIVESSQDAIISKNLKGIITSWNTGAERIFGYKEDEIIGKPVTMLIPAERLKEEKHILASIRAGKKVDHFETIRVDKYGRKIPISLTVSPVVNSQKKIIGASKIARNISEQVKSQAEIKKYMNNLGILNSIGKSISENMDVQVILQQVTDATTTLTGAAFGAFFYNQENEEGESMMLYTLSGAPREAFEKFGMPRHTQVFKPTFAGQGVVRVDDITKDPRYGHNRPHDGMPAGHLPVVSYLAVPVISKTGVVIGGLIFGHPEKGKFTAEHEAMVSSIAAQAAISLDNSKLFEQVKSLSEKKDEFIALASHELKTPLTTIKGYLQVLSKKQTDTMSELFLKKSLDQVNKLNSLVEDLLNMSRIEAGKLEFRLEEFDLRQMLLEITETFSYLHKTHQLIYNLGDSPALIEGDKQRIEQAILNLMTNAVKYSPGANKVYLDLKLHRDKVTVIIRDVGIGLTPEQQNQLFSRYYRAENTKGISGLGLGLYLTKQIIDRHEGEIYVNSKAGEGSEFSFTLPLKEPMA